MGLEKDFYLNPQMVKARIFLIIEICVSGNPAHLRSLKFEFRYCSDRSKRSKTVIFWGDFSAMEFYAVKFSCRSAGRPANNM